MFDLNLDNPKHDLAMEVLCSMSTTPIDADLLVEDLNEAGVTMSRDKLAHIMQHLRVKKSLCIQEIRGRGYQKFYRIAEPSWRRVKFLTREYLARLEGREMPIYHNN